MKSRQNAGAFVIAAWNCALRRAGPRCCMVCRATSTIALTVLLTTGAMAGEETPPEANSSFLSRVTIVVPVFTRHIPHDKWFNDHNWGAFVDVALNRQLSVVMGDFINSYKRNTLFAGISYMPINLEFSKVKIDLGGMLALDINGGYRPFNDLNPLLGVFSIKVTGTHFEDTKFAILNRLGIAITIFPNTSGGSTALNFALTYKL